MKNKYELKIKKISFERREKEKEKIWENLKLKVEAKSLKSQACLIIIQRNPKAGGSYSHVPNQFYIIISYLINQTPKFQTVCCSFYKFSQSSSSLHFILGFLALIFQTFSKVILILNSSLTLLLLPLLHKLQINFFIYKVSNFLIS